MFYDPYQRKSYPNKYQMAQYPGVRRPPISIDPPTDLPEGRDSGVSSPPVTMPDNQMPRRVPTQPPLPEQPRRIPRAPGPIMDDFDEIYPPRRPPSGSIPPFYPDDSYPRRIPDYEDEYEPGREIPIPMPERLEPSPIRTRPRTQQPSRPSRQQPPPYDTDTFIKDGQQYVCEWVYCCRPVDSQMPERLEPNPNEDYMDIVIWQDDTFPEYKVERCNTNLGFCMSTRESTFRIIARIIYPKDVTGEVQREIEDCLEIGAIAALGSIELQIEGMKAVPESIPAVIPTILKTAFIAGKEAFFVCLREKASYEFLANKVRFSVFHDQTSNEGWRQMNERDVIRLLEKMYLYSSGLAMIPGVGSFDDLANKLGVNRIDLEGIFRSPGKSVSDVGNKLKEKATGLGEEIKGRAPTIPPVSDWF